MGGDATAQTCAVSLHKARSDCKPTNDDEPLATERQALSRGSPEEACRTSGLSTRGGAAQRQSARAPGRSFRDVKTKKRVSVYPHILGFLVSISRQLSGFTASAAAGVACRLLREVLAS